MQKGDTYKVISGPYSKTTVEVVKPGRTNGTFKVIESPIERLEKGNLLKLKSSILLPIEVKKKKKKTVKRKKVDRRVLEPKIKSKIDSLRESLNDLRDSMFAPTRINMVSGRNIIDSFKEDFNDVINNIDKFHDAASSDPKGKVDSFDKRLKILAKDFQKIKKRFENTEREWKQEGKGKTNYDKMPYEKKIVENWRRERDSSVVDEDREDVEYEGDDKVRIRIEEDTGENKMSFREWTTSNNPELKELLRDERLDKIANSVTHTYSPMSILKFAKRFSVNRSRKGHPTFFVESVESCGFKKLTLNGIEFNLEAVPLNTFHLPNTIPFSMNGELYHIKKGLDGDVIYLNRDNGILYFIQSLKVISRTKINDNDLVKLASGKGILKNVNS